MFGGKTVYKNFFEKEKYCETFSVAEITKHFGLTREKMILLAMLTGSDYTEGIDNVGPVTAMEILAELTQLTWEEKQISEELVKLQEVLRSQDEDTEMDESDVEALLQKYVSLVNEKNSVVRRQMQLNIAKKERAVEHKKKVLQEQLQKFSDLDDSQKTEAMRLEEEMLLQQYVEAVNEKNALVHECDSQERLIAEDESIRSFVANRDILAKPGQPKPNILDEFLDFFKK